MCGKGEVKARYLPLLLYGIAFGLAFGHALLLFRQGTITVGQVITYMALLGTLRSPIRFLLTNFVSGAAEHRQRAAHPVD